MQREQLEKGKEMSEFEARASEVDGTEVALQRLRKEGEACVVPNTFFKKIGAGRRVGGGSSSSSKSGSESNGCVALRISPSGNFIAASFARNDPRMSQVLIFSTAQGAKLVRWLCGHTDLVSGFHSRSGVLEAPRFFGRVSLCWVNRCGNVSCPSRPPCLAMLVAIVEQ